MTQANFDMEKQKIFRNARLVMEACLAEALNTIARRRWPICVVLIHTYLCDIFNE